MAYIHATDPALRMTAAAQLRAMGTPAAAAELARRKHNRAEQRVVRTPAVPVSPSFAFLAQPTPVAAPVATPVATPVAAPVQGRGKGGRVTLTQRVEALEGGISRIEALLMRAIG